MTGGSATTDYAPVGNPVDAQQLDDAVRRASDSLLALQHADGHWIFELEADATISAEYILLEHYLGRIQPELQQHIARFLRAAQGRSWRLAAILRR